MTELLHSTQDIEQQALAVWQSNDRHGRYMVPHSPNYEGLWLWDSALHGIGMRHHDPVRAGVEIGSVVDGQQPDGFIPNLQIRAGGLAAQVESLMWGNLGFRSNSLAHIGISQITQPPILAEAVWQIGQKMEHVVRQNFWTQMIGRLALYHDWIYRERNYRGDGLFTAIHPWETGQDNTPPMMEHCRQLRFGGRVMDLLSNLSQHPLIRRDINYVDASERSTYEEGKLQALALLSLMRHQFHPQRIRESHPLHYQDVGMSSMLIANNRHLEVLADETGVDLSDELSANMRMTESNLEQLWDTDASVYYPRDAVTGESIRIQTSSSLLPMYAGYLPRERIEILHAQLADPENFWSYAGMANVPLNSPYRREKGYWHEVWVNTNWLAATMLERNGYGDEASEMRQKTLRVINQQGMCEYFSARTGQGMGVRGFGWTAMLALDMLHTDDN